MTPRQRWLRANAMMDHLLSGPRWERCPIHGADIDPVPSVALWNDTNEGHLQCASVELDGLTVAQVTRAERGR